MARTKDDGEAVEGAAKGGKKKMMIVGALAAVALAGGGVAAGTVLSKDAAAATHEEVLVAGDVVALEPISLNLADGHYLKLGLALQAVASEGGGHGGSHGPDGSKALDLAIAEFSGVPMEELTDPALREQRKLALQEKIIHAYEEETDGVKHKTVMGIYLTQFVMQ